MLFKRLLQLEKVKGSAFVFGPRMTGKTFLIGKLPAALAIDLLDPQQELSLRREPHLFWEQLQALKEGSQVILDEVQKVPVLLDYVQKGIEEKKLRFILCGSSARKLRRGGANLLGGRALDLRLHPLMEEEIGKKFSLEEALQFGTLPKITQCLFDRDTQEARRLLNAYYTIYIKEEIQAEALTRSVGAFQRFLAVAAQANGQVIEFSNISRECSVPASTVKEYFSILEDTLLGEFLWPWDRSERKKARPKFYFFDCGVVRAIQNRLQDPPTSEERGILFETWFVREIIRLRDYLEKPYTVSFWRQGPHEIDLLISGSRGPMLAMECKSGHSQPYAATFNAFKEKFSKVPVVIASLGERTPRKLDSGLEILPWESALERFRKL